MMKSNQTPPPSSSKPSSVLPRKTPNLTEHYTLGKQLGQGSHGTTYLCIDKSNGKEYACKSIPKSNLNCKQDYEVVLREIEIMHHVSDLSNVARVKETFEDSEFVHLVMELCEGGTLFKRIMHKRPYTERKAARLIKTVVEVVEGCHSLGVMHRDLKPDNFLFVNNDDDAALKAIDFGSSVFYKPGDTFYDVAGSPYYVAPEVLLRHYGPEADVWSAGRILYFLLIFCTDTEADTFSLILQGNLDFESEPWPSISDSAKDLLRNMLNPDPTKRYTAHQVLCHQWIVGDGVAPEKPLDSAVLSRLKRFSAMNKLKKMALRVIAKMMTDEEIAGLKILFKIFDTDNSGTITYDQLKEGLQKLGSDLMEAEIQSLMDAADIGKTGTIDCDEFVVATLHLNKLEREENLRNAFSFFDKDGNGYITIDDLSQACKEFGLGDVNVHEMIKDISQNNVCSLLNFQASLLQICNQFSELQHGRIDSSEFAAMMRTKEEPIRRV